MNPVNFGNKDKDPVDLIFAMCTTDKNSHRFALTQLGKLLDDEEMLEVLRNEKNKIKMIEKINKFLDIVEEYI
jgi:PTS system ascorbate-specific IIA component